MTERPEKLEQLIAGLARGQPPLRAPASLEARVFAQIAAQSGWRRGFAHWPLMARALFLVASIGFIKLALAGLTAVSTTVSMGALVLQAIPPFWLYASAAVAFTLYVVLFGLGTVAYRTLYVQR